METFFWLLGSTYKKYCSLAPSGKPEPSWECKAAGDRKRSHYCLSVSPMVEEECGHSPQKNPTRHVPLDSAQGLTKGTFLAEETQKGVDGNTCMQMDTRPHTEY
ncbi:Gimap6 [Phodopus roborovskii]|uniref:Gimap6 protein n=1 Tax=Phodopus roborovskii TaxID=109678 RepID=A0AAV0A4Y3_PHORO|nr:Gimap6 [Phodopus roborovskii]